MEPPVFIVGSARSGTTLLYHLLLSSGGFAIYRGETHAFNLMGPRFGRLGKRADRDRLMDAWLASEFLRRSGLEAEPLRSGKGRSVGRKHP